MNRQNSFDIAPRVMGYDGGGFGRGHLGDSQAGESIDFDGVLNIVRRRLRLILGVFLLVSAAGIAITLLQPPRYTATALLMIDPSPDQFMNLNQSLTRGSPNDVIVESEIEILKSEDLAARLARDLNLDADPEFNEALKEAGPVDQVLEPAIAFVTTLLPPGFGSSTDQTVDQDPDGAVSSDVVRAVAEAISIRRRGLSFAIDVSFEASTPRKSADLANTLTEAYLDARKESRFANVGRASEWFDGRLEALKAEALNKEGEVQAFRAAKGLLTAEGVSLTEQQIAEVQTSVIQARAEHAEAQARYGYLMELINSGESADSIAGALNSEVIRDLRVHEAAVAQKQADLENRYGPLHPELARVRSERADIQAQIQLEIDRIASSIRAEAQVVGARVRTLEASLDNTRRSLVSNNSELARLGELETEARAARAVYESFLERSHEVKEQGTLAAAEAEVISTARSPESPSSPRVLFLSVLSVVGGLGLALIAVVFAEKLRKTFESPEEAGRKTGISVLGAVPELEKSDLRMLPAVWRHPTKYLVERPMTTFGESIRALRTSVHLAVPAKTTPIVAITSALPGEGKTTTSMCLARISAMAGKRTVIVDCDVRKRSLNSLIGIKPERGVLELLNGDANLSEILGQDDDSAAHVIPAAPSKLVGQELFASDAMEALMDQLANAYDLVVLDCPPILAVAETRQILTHADTTVLVARCNQTPAKAAVAAAHFLQTAHAPLAGLLVNCFNPRSAGGSPYYNGVYYVQGGDGYYGDVVA